MSEYIKRKDAVKVAAQVLTEVAPVLFPGTIAEEIIEKRMNDLPEAEIRTGDRISRCELFNRLATITAEDPNEMKAKIYEAIQEMETSDRQQEWIPCSERLPSEDEQDPELGVIVTLGNGYSGLQYDWYRNGHWYDWDGFVVAWMPLPKPWKGESNAKEA